MVWKGVKVVRVLKGAHSGPVGHIAVFEDGSVVSGGEKDGALVMFNEAYELMGAGATLPSHTGSVRSGFIFCVLTIFVQKANIHLFSSSLPRFDKCHEMSRIFPRTEQTFASARSFGVIS